jgi:hypothetical protein
MKDGTAAVLSIKRREVRVTGPSVRDRIGVFLS